MNPWHDARLLNQLANLLFALALAATLGVGLWWLSQRGVFTLRTVEIAPADGASLGHVPDAALRETVAQQVRGNFFSVDLNAVRAVLETVPWVRKASVRRIWPHTLHVDVEEHSARALWNDGRLVNTYGELFSANLGEAEENGPLPQFGGPQGTEALVARRFDELRELVTPLGVAAQGLTLSDRHAWTMKLDDGTTLLLGREHGVPLQGRLTRWVETYPQVVAELSRRAQLIDLRYPNGFAIRSLAMLAEDEDPASDGSGGADDPAKSDASRAGSQRAGAAARTNGSRPSQALKSASAFKRATSPQRAQSSQGAGTAQRARPPQGAGTVRPAAARSGQERR